MRIERFNTVDHRQGSLTGLSRQHAFIREFRLPNPDV